MRKTTISVASLLALGVAPAVFAETITVKWPSSAIDATGATPVQIGDFYFVGNNSKVTLTGSGFYTGGSSNATARHIYFTPAKNGKLTVKGSPSADNTDRYIIIANAPTGDANAESVIAKVAIHTKGKAQSVTADLLAGQTYYICLAGNGTITGITYEEASVSNDIALKIAKDNQTASVDVTLNKGTYKFTAAEGLTIKVAKGDEVLSPNGESVLITENGTKVTVTVDAGKKVSADTDADLKMSISDSDLNAVKSVYQQKIAVMINKANVYTNDETLQECAVKASALMASANNIGLNEYNEYITTGGIEALDDQIEAQTEAIKNAQANYEGFAYAQEKYGNEYKDGAWVAKETPAGLLAKKAELDAALAGVTDETAQAAAQEVYNQAKAQIDQFLTDATTEYEANSVKDANSYKSTIDKKVEAIEETVATAISAIQDGGLDATSYANVVARIGQAKGVYNSEAQKLYNLLTQPGDGYNDMYVEALAELNNYLRTINQVEKDNKDLHATNKCTEQSQSDFYAQLASIVKLNEADPEEEIYGVYKKYEEKATTLRANYKAAKDNIKSQATDYLESQVKNLFVVSEDVKRAEVEAQYAGDVAAIEASIAALQENVNKADAAHTIETLGNGVCDKYAEDLAAIRTAVDELNGKVQPAADEWDAWQGSLESIQAAQASFDAEKKTVAETKGADEKYTQAGKFAAEYEATIQARIDAIKKAADESFKADGSGNAAEFLAAINNDVKDEEGNVAMYGLTSIKGQIDAYKTEAAATLNMYNKIFNELASYDLALNGKGEEGKEGYVAGLKDVATNLDVTIDGQVKGKSYGTYIAETEKKIADLKAGLDAAVALNDAKYIEAMGKLQPIDGLAAEIEGLSGDTYTTNLTNWNKNQLADAKTSMLEEANRRVAAISTEGLVQNENYKDEFNTEVDTEKPADNTSYKKETYGLKYAELEGLLAGCNKNVSDINKKIADAENKGDAEAVAILSEVVAEIDKAEEAYDALETKAQEYKEAYTAEKALNKVLVGEIKTKLTDEIAKITFEKVAGTNYFATEQANQADATNKLAEALKKSYEAETVRQDEEALRKTLNEIEAVVNTLKGLVEKEAANKKANDDFTRALADAKLQEALNAALTYEGIDVNTPGYAYFNGLKAEYAQEKTNIENAQTVANGAMVKVLGEDKKPVAGTLDEAKYTDTEKNMAHELANLTQKVADLKAKIEALNDQNKANEISYAGQVAKEKELKATRDEVFNKITTAQTSSYHEEALAMLQEQDKAIEKYNEDYNVAYGEGKSATNAADLTKQSDAIANTLKTLNNGWDSEYEKHVAEDNLARKDRFDDQYKTLTEAYNSAVNLITDLSKLSYADETITELDNVINGTANEPGIYSYAEMIRNLKAEATAAYDGTVSPDLFDPTEAYAATGKEYQDKINNMAKEYSDAINNIALSTYNSQFTTANGMLNDAKTEAKTSLGVDVAFEKVQGILDEAQTIANIDPETGKSKNLKFALELDSKIIPAFDNIPTVIAEEKEAAAVAVWDELKTKYEELLEKEAKDIAGFADEDGNLGTYSEAHAEDVAVFNNAQTVWAEIEEGEKYANYATAQAELAKFTDGLKDLQVGENEEGNPVYEKHTQVYINAYNADAKFHANDIAYEQMLDDIAKVQSQLDDAMAFVATLFIENNAAITGDFSYIKGRIDLAKSRADRYYSQNAAANPTNQGYVRQALDQAIVRLDPIKGKAIGSEYDALKIEIGKLQNDYNNATAAEIENAELDRYKEVISGYQEENEAIYRDFTVGKVDADGLIIYEEDEEGKQVPVLATAGETQEAFLKLEKKIGNTKAELTAVYNAAAMADAQKAVEDTIAALTAQYEALNAQLAECHEPVVTRYQPQADAFKAGIDALQAELDAEIADGTLLLHVDNNLETAGKLATSVSGLDGDIEDMEKPYDINDEYYAKHCATLQTLRDNLAAVSATAAGYEYPVTGSYEYGTDAEGNPIIYTDYREYIVAYITNMIEERQTDLDSKYETCSVTESYNMNAGEVQSTIDYNEKYLAFNNAKLTLQPLETAINSLYNVIVYGNNYAPTDREALKERQQELAELIKLATEYNEKAFNGSVEKDLDGNDVRLTETTPEGEEVKVSKPVVYIEEYGAIMERAANIADQYNALNTDVEGKTWMRGDIDRNGKITVNDYTLARQMVLELYVVSETSPEFYAADVSKNGAVNIGDVTQIGSKILNPDYDFKNDSPATSYAKAMGFGVQSNGTLSVAAVGTGLEQTVKVAVDSELAFVGAQFDVVLPKGVKLTSTYAPSHEADFNTVQNGAVRVIVSNMENVEIVNGQAFVELNVEVSSEYSGGEIVVQNAQFADAEGTVFTLAKASTDTATGITNLTTVEKVQSKIYSVGGAVMNKMKRGINIIVNSDGTTTKVAK